MSSVPPGRGYSQSALPKVRKLHDRSDPHDRLRKGARCSLRNDPGAPRPWAEPSRLVIAVADTARSRAIADRISCGLGLRERRSCFSWRG